MVAVVVRVTPSRRRRLQVMATAMVAVGIFMVVVRGDQGIARTLLIPGMIYAVAIMIADWRARKP